MQTHCPVTWSQADLADPSVWQLQTETKMVQIMVQVYIFRTLITSASKAGIGPESWQAILTVRSCRTGRALALSASGKVAVSFGMDTRAVVDNLDGFPFRLAAHLTGTLLHVANIQVLKQKMHNLFHLPLS